MCARSTTEWKAISHRVMGWECATVEWERNFSSPRPNSRAISVSLFIIPLVLLGALFYMYALYDRRQQQQQPMMISSESID